MKKLFSLFFLFLTVAGISKLSAAESSPQFIQGTDTLVVYKDVPGLAPSDKYTMRVRSAATNNEWVDVFANVTNNRAVPGSTSLNSPDMYQVNAAAWSHAYGNIEMNTGQIVEVEIAAKPGFKIAGKDFEKAKVHPAQKASAATLVNGKVYFTITKPGQLYIDINGQMDDYNRAINPIGHPVHVVTLWANPVIKKPTLTGSRVRTIEPGTSFDAINAINPADYDTMYFKPGVHDLASGIKMHPGKTIYIPGDVYIYGSFNNYGVPAGSFSRNGENITIYGYGTICGVKIPHYQVSPEVKATLYPGVVVDGGKGIEIENGKNYRLFGLTITDPSNHSIDLVGDNGSLKWMKTITWRVNGDGFGGYTPAEDCFIRSHDDCSYVKANKKRCTFWKDSNARLFYFNGVPEYTTNPIIIEDCDILYARLRTNPGSNGGGFTGDAGGKVNIIIRDIRIHDKLVNMKIFNFTPGASSFYEGILFQNISIAGMASGNKQKLIGTAAVPWNGGVIFDNVTIGGVKLTSSNFKTYFETNDYVKYILFGMPKDLTLTTIADPSKGSITRNIVQEIYKENTKVTLTATTKSGYIFSHWSGDATGTSNPITVFVYDKNMSITANFIQPDFSKALVIDAPGLGSITIPDGVDSISMKVWSGGGAGGSASNDSIGYQTRAGGGAGGSFVFVKKKVTAGQVLTYTVGAGGLPASQGFLNYTVEDIQNGGSSMVSLDSEVIALALGGPGGQNATESYSTGSKGIAPQIGNIGNLVFYGGNGATASAGGSGGGGGSAGAKGKGGDAPNPVSGNAPGGIAGEDGGAAGGNGTNATKVGASGSSPGAGGSGAIVRAVRYASLEGGKGANGKIIFSFKVDTSYTEVKIIKTLSNPKLNIYPNPVIDIIHINFSDTETNKEIKIYNILGEVVEQLQTKNAHAQLDVKSLNLSGTLLIQIIEGNAISNHRVIVKK